MEQRETPLMALVKSKVSNGVTSYTKFKLIGTEKIARTTEQLVTEEIPVLVADAFVAHSAM